MNFPYLALSPQRILGKRWDLFSFLLFFLRKSKPRENCSPLLSSKHSFAKRRVTTDGRGFSTESTGTQEHYGKHFQSTWHILFSSFCVMYPEYLASHFRHPGNYSSKNAPDVMYSPGDKPSVETEQGVASLFVCLFIYLRASFHIKSSSNMT